MLAQLMQQAAAGNGGDPYWANVVSLNHFDGADKSTTLTDETGLVWTPAGSAQLSVAESLFGGSSLVLNGSTDYITAPTGAPFQFGTGAFTVELAVFLNALPASNGYALYDNCPIGGSGARATAFVLIVDTTGALNVFSNGAFAGASAQQLAAGAWYRVALTRTGNTWRYFVQGTVDTTVLSLSTNVGTGGCVVGRTGDAAGYFIDGYVDELRITKGVCRYVADYKLASAEFPKAA